MQAVTSLVWAPTRLLLLVGLVLAFVIGCGMSSRSVAAAARASSAAVRSS